MLRLLILAVILAVLALAFTGCGSTTVTTTSADGQLATQAVPNIRFAKAKFALHMGLAFGAFHRYIYKPFQTGAFNAGSPHRLRTFVKGGSAALFAVHELRTAREDALSNDRLRPLAERIEPLRGRLTSLGSSLKHGSLDTNAILAAAGAVSTLGSESGGLGVTIKELSPAL
jgi:hypothetical protein